MKIALTRIPLADSIPPVIPPLALYALAAAVRSRGHEVDVIDPYDGGAALRDGDFGRLTGCDLLGLTADSFNWGVTKAAIAGIKAARSDLVTVAGGVHPTHFPEATAGGGIDYVIAGDGEQPFLALIETLEQGLHPSGPGLFPAFGRGTPPARAGRLEEQPVPAYDLVPAGLYPTMPFETSRGCPGRCRFCSSPGCGRYRTMTDTAVLQRLESALSLASGRFLARSVYFTDDCFTGDPKRTVRLCRELAGRNWDRRFGFEARVADLLKPGVVAAIAGLDPIMVQIGVECGYDEGLTAVGKRITTAQAREAAGLVRDSGLSHCAMYTFIVGLPWEDRSDCMRTVHFAASLIDESGGRGSTSWFGLLPSDLWQRRAEWGIAVDHTMFDLPQGGNVELFSELHPRLSAADFDAINEVIGAYETGGTVLRQSMGWGWNRG